MTADLKQYIDSLHINVFRMIDGSVVLADERHRDINENYVVLSRPLQMCAALDKDSVKSVFIPWMPGISEELKVRLNNVIAEAEATFEQKFAYSRFYLIAHLEKLLPPEEFNQVMEKDLRKTAPDADTLQLPQVPSKLQAELFRQKRFKLN